MRSESIWLSVTGYHRAGGLAALLVWWSSRQTFFLCYHWHWTRVSGVFLKFLPDWLSSSICGRIIVGMDSRGFLFRCLVYGWCLLSQCSLDRPVNPCGRRIITEEVYVGAVPWKVICMPICLCASLILPPFPQQWRCRNRVMELLWWENNWGGKKNPQKDFDTNAAAPMDDVKATFLVSDENV